MPMPSTFLTPKAARLCTQQLPGTDRSRWTFFWREEVGNASFFLVEGVGLGREKIRTPYSAVRYFPLVYRSLCAAGWKTKKKEAWAMVQYFCDIQALDCLKCSEIIACSEQNPKRSLHCPCCIHRYIFRPSNNLRYQFDSFFFARS